MTKTYTEEEMQHIVEFSSTVERLRERAIFGMNLALQRGRAAGDANESILAMEWVAANIEVLIVNYIRQAQQAPEQKPEEPNPPVTMAAKDKVVIAVYLATRRRINIHAAIKGMTQPEYVDSIVPAADGEGNEKPV